MHAPVHCICARTHTHTCIKDWYGFTGFQVTCLRCSRFEKTVRSKKNEKPVFTGDITTNTTPPELEASSMAESQEKFVANPKGKAPIWEFFHFRCKDGQVDSTKAYCTECKASVKLGGGTSNMSAHVHRHHPLLLNKPFGKAKVMSVRNPPGGKNTLRIWNPKVVTFYECITPQQHLEHIFIEKYTHPLLTYTWFATLDANTG